MKTAALTIDSTPFTTDPDTGETVEWARRNYGPRALGALDRRCLIVILKANGVDYVKASEAGRALLAGGAS